MCCLTREKCTIYACIIVLQGNYNRFFDKCEKSAVCRLKYKRGEVGVKNYSYLYVGKGCF